MNPILYKYYKILEVDPQAEFAEIKRAYHDLVWVWHPDRFPQNERLQQKAHQKLKEINEAYDVLKDQFNQHDSKDSNQDNKNWQHNHHEHERDRSNKNEQNKWEDAFGKDFSDQQQNHSSPFNDYPKRHRRVPIYPFVQLALVILILFIGIYIYSGALMKSPIISESDKISQDWGYFDHVFGEPQEELFPIGNQDNENNEQIVSNEKIHTVPQNSKAPLEKETTLPDHKDSFQQKTINNETIQKSKPIQEKENINHKINVEPTVVTPEPTKIPSYFSLGSSKQNVVAAQGEPERTYKDRITGIEILEYGKSSVKLGGIHKQVIAWDNQDNNLNIQMNLEPVSSSGNSFTIGSHKNEVFIIQGLPDKVSSYPESGYQVWRYGYSSIIFSLNTGRILNIKNTDNNLKIAYTK